MILSCVLLLSPIQAKADGLTARGGVYYNENNYKETYYNLKMNGVVRRMRERGYSEEEYPYWIREDGAKMLGDYIIVAADLSIHPRGATLYTSLGPGIVCDTGTKIKGKRLDLAMNW